MSLSIDFIILIIWLKIISKGIHLHILFLSYNQLFLESIL